MLHMEEEDEFIHDFDFKVISLGIVGLFATFHGIEKKHQPAVPSAINGFHRAKTVCRFASVQCSHRPSNTLARTA